MAGLSMLASLKQELGDLDRVTQWIRAVGYVHCAPDFGQNPAVVNGFSREVELEMTLEEFQQDSLVRYTSHQRGLPSARHERRFTTAPSGFDYTLSVSFEPRAGPTGIFDRVVVKRAVASALHKTIENLERVFDQRLRS